jgi:hypothetical protein
MVRSFESEMLHNERGNGTQKAHNGPQEAQEAQKANQFCAF